MSTLESLKKSFEFKYVFHNGRRYKAAHLGVYISNGKKRGVRVGLVVSKRVGNAVVRNRVKRLFREAARNIPALSACAFALDVVLLAGPATPPASYGDIRKELGAVVERHLDRLKTRQPLETRQPLRTT